MSKLSMLEEKISSKDENWYINQCSSFNKIDEISTPYGSVKVYEVGSDKVELQFNYYSNGEDDYDEELVEVKIINNPPF